MVRKTHFRLMILVVLWTITLVPIAASAQLNIPPLARRFVYDADFLPPSHFSNLEKLISGHERQTTSQDVHVTTRSLKVFRIQGFSHQLFDPWGVGQSTRNNGVLLIVAPNERKVKIEPSDIVFFIVVVSVFSSFFFERERRGRRRSCGRHQNTNYVKHKTSDRGRSSQKTPRASVAVLAVTVPRVAGDALIHL